MIKTTYQTPELRDANDNVVQEGAFGKNTALANSTNDGWIDYVMNDLEALHDTIGDSAPTLDGNGHVVEPANLAIGDEDGLRIKNNYLKLSGGNVTGITSFRTDLRMLDNQDNRFGGLYVPGSSSTQQYMQFYSGTRATGDARLTLYPSGDGRFSLLAYSNDGSTSYELRGDNNGNLNWRGYPLAWKKDCLSLTGGTMTRPILFNYNTAVAQTVDNSYLYFYGGRTIQNDGARLTLTGKSHSWAGGWRLEANDGTNIKVLIGNADGTLTWNNKNVERVEASGANYIRYTNGLQICFGGVGSMTADGITVTFPQPFTSAPVPSFSTSGATNFAYVTAVTATDMAVKTSNNGGSVRYIAIGRWA